MEPDPTNDPPEPARARTVLNYFFRHPRAADTLEGVVRWRLLEEQVQRAMAETRDAIEWLVSKGYLKEDSRAYSGAIYSLNQEEAAEIERFLSGKQKSPDPEN
jgi:hypothetical protein